MAYSEFLVAAGAIGIASWVAGLIFAAESSKDARDRSGLGFLGFAWPLSMFVAGLVWRFLEVFSRVK